MITARSGSFAERETSSSRSASASLASGIIRTAFLLPLEKRTHLLAVYRRKAPKDKIALACHAITKEGLRQTFVKYISANRFLQTIQADGISAYSEPINPALLRLEVAALIAAKSPRPILLWAMDRVLYKPAPLSQKDHSRNHGPICPPELYGLAVAYFRMWLGAIYLRSKSHLRVRLLRGGEFVRRQFS